ncbi:hypothetical protein [Desulfurococcus amylolyticus]|nr:hypothetical protein [Desulfurococcus amylolyticus]
MLEILGYFQYLVNTLCVLNNVESSKNGVMAGKRLDHTCVL